MNFQNLPAHDERAALLKAAITSKFGDNGALLFADYQGMEFRIFGFYLAHQPTIADYTIVKEFLRGEDVYENTGRLILGRDPTKDERSTYKRAALSLLYNGSYKTIREQGLADTDDAAQDIVDAILEARPQIAVIKQLTQRVMKQRGHVKTLWGRQLEGPTHNKKGNPWPAARRPMVNYLIQGTASDIMKDAILNVSDFLQKGLYSSHVVLTIHDEIGLDCVEEEIPSIVAALPGLMANSTIEKYLPLGVDIAIARGSWANEVEYVTGKPLDPEPPWYGDDDDDEPLPWED